MTYYLFLLYCVCEVLFYLCNLTEDYINLGYQLVFGLVNYIFPAEHCSSEPFIWVHSVYI